MKAGFAQTDITPPTGTKKIGWMKDLKGEVILDPLMASAAVFEKNGEKIGFIQLDTLSVRWSQVNNIRNKIAEQYGVPAQNIMISATHNHAGPAAAGVFPVERDNKYISFLENKCVDGFGNALSNLQEAELGFGSAKNFKVAHNRRSRMRDGTVKSQTSSKNPMFLCPEGPRDPEVAVLAARRVGGDLLGCMVNYACHPTHHGGTNEFSAGFPGVVRKILRENGCPVCLYLNGAYGNVISNDYERQISLSKEEAGKSIAKDAHEVMDGLSFSQHWPLASTCEYVELPYREITAAEHYGRVFGAQRFRSDELYEAYIDGLVERIKERKVQPAELQVLQCGDVYYAGVPAEYFVEFQLRIKECSHPKNALTVGGANGMIGYVPTREAFLRGGYETTLGPPSRMAPETGDIIADKVIGMINS